MIHNLVLVAGVKQTIPSGFYVKVMSAAAVLDVRLYDADGQGLLIVNAEDISQGDAFNEPRGFGFAEIESATAQTVAIQILPVVMQSTNLVGDVNALTRFDNLTLDGNQWFGGVSHPAGGAGLRTQTMLWNPAGSGVELHVSVLRSNAAGDNIYFTRHTNTTGYAEDSFVNTFINNKELTVATASLAELWSRQDGSVVLGTTCAALPTDTNKTPTPLDFKNAPIIIAAGRGLNAATVNTNIDLSNYFEWSEELI